MIDNSSVTIVIGRVDSRNGTVKMLGTGFIVESRYIITCLHVVGGDDRDLVFLMPHIDNLNEYQDTTKTHCQIIPISIKEADPITDLCVLVPNNITGFLARSWELGTLDEINVGEPIGLLGFPHCVHGRRVITYQETLLGAKTLQETNGIKKKYGIVNIQTRPGQSGSPVYNLLNNKVVGVLCGSYAPSKGISLGGINPHELHQTSFCVSAEYIKDMIK